MRIEYDEAHDRATFTFVERRQSHEHGYTEAFQVAGGVMVQIGFEAPSDLLWLSVEPASRALPSKLLDGAKPL